MVMENGRIRDHLEAVGGAGVNVASVVPAMAPTDHTATNVSITIAANKYVSANSRFSCC